MRRACSPPAGAIVAVRHAGLVHYARDCTETDDRILATWFMPELYTYAARGFAGGMVVFFGGHWSEHRQQQRILSRLDAQSVPLVFIELSSYTFFRQDYPLIDDYLHANYTIASESSLAARGESPAAFDRRCIPPGGVAPRSQMPKFAPSSRLALAGRGIVTTRSRCNAGFHHGLLGTAVLEDPGYQVLARKGLIPVATNQPWEWSCFR